jgi:hypothetical protein
MTGVTMSTMEARGQHAPAGAAAVAETIMQRLELAWNRADGAAFGEPFSADADFVAIRGDLHTGREAIAAGHQQIFDTITIVLLRHDDEYEITAFHNTLVTG